MPGASRTSLHPIVHLISEPVNADGNIDQASLRIAWIPLRGTIRVDRFRATPST